MRPLSASAAWVSHLSSSSPPCVNRSAKLGTPFDDIGTGRQVPGITWILHSVLLCLAYPLWCKLWDTRICRLAEFKKMMQLNYGRRPNDSHYLLDCVVDLHPSPFAADSAPVASVVSGFSLICVCSSGDWGHRAPHAVQEKPPNSMLVPGETCPPRFPHSFHPLTAFYSTVAIICKLVQSGQLRRWQMLLPLAVFSSLAMPLGDVSRFALVKTFALASPNLAKPFLTQPVCSQPCWPCPSVM